MAATSTNLANGQPTFGSSLTGLPVTGSNSANPQLLGVQGTGGILGELYGQVPGVANPISSANQAASGNTGNLSQIANLTQGTDILSAEGAALPFQMNLPNYQSNLNQAATNTGQELSGQLPADVQNQIQQAAAERGVSTGQSGYGSPNINASYLQALGLNSLGMTQQGQSNLSTLIGETPTGASFNPATMFVTPQDEQGANQAVETAMAAPDPAASGVFSSIMSLI